MSTKRKASNASDSKDDPPQKKHRASTVYEDYTVGWICALPKEQTAAVAFLDCRHESLPNPPNDPNAYFLGSSGKHSIVIACLPKGKYGQNSAAMVATHMINTFPNIRFGLLVGIGGGMPPGVRLGDVVVSTPVGQYPGVVQWDMGKAEDGGKFKRTGALNNPPSILLTALSKLETIHDIGESRIQDYIDDLIKRSPRLDKRFTTTRSLVDPLDTPEVTLHHNKTDAYPLTAHRLQSDTADQACTAHVKKPERGADRPGKHRRELRVHHGLIASGNQVIKDSEVRDRINKELDDNVLCFEMEAAGLMNEFPCLVIRGICDYADSSKNKNWQEYAATVAAAYAKELLAYVALSEVGAVIRAKDVLDQIRGKVESIDSSVSRLESRHRSEQDLKILDWLTPIDYGARHSDILRRRQPGTCQWLLDTTEYHTWLNEGGRTLFCPGIPGAGKTVLASVVIDTVMRRAQDDKTIGYAYLYFDYKQREMQTAENLAAVLLKQLCLCRQALPQGIEDLHTRHKERRTRPTGQEISSALQSAIASYSRVYILADALDECQENDGCRNAFIGQLFSLQATSGVSIFATSRFLPDVQALFDGSISMEIRANQEDVQRYLRYHARKLPGFILRDEQLRGKIVEKIAIIVDGIFLLAKLYLETLSRKNTKRQVKDALTSFLERSMVSGQLSRQKVLDTAYDEAMARIEKQSEEATLLAHRTLAWISSARRPLTARELRVALAIEVGAGALDMDNRPYVEDMISVCAGLVTIEEESSVVRLVHYTVQQYLESRHSAHQFNADEMISSVCLTYLSFETVRGGRFWDPIAWSLRLRTHAFSDYAAYYWVSHAKRVAPVQKEVFRFLQKSTNVEAWVRSLEFKRSDDRYSRLMRSRSMSELHIAAMSGFDAVARILLERGAYADTQNRDGRAPLAIAAAFGSVGIAKQLVEAGCNINVTDLDGRTPLIWACYYNQLDLVDYLLAHGADFDRRDDSDHTALFYSISKRACRISRLLIGAGAEQGRPDSDGETLLSKASRMGMVKTCRLMCATGASIDFPDLDGRSPLSQAAEGGHAGVVELLLGNTADLNSQDNCGRTPLSYAAEAGHIAVVELLLNNTADSSLQDDRGWTPLLYASKHGRVEVVHSLLRHDAQVDFSERESQTPLLIACRYDHIRVAEVLMATRNANVNARDLSGLTPLLWSCRLGNKELVNLLINNDADINARNILGDTALSETACYGHFKISKPLLYSGRADVNITSANNETPLFLAVKEGSLKVVKFLLLEGRADATIRTNDGRTAWSQAKGCQDSGFCRRDWYSCEHPEILKLLDERVPRPQRR